MPERVHVHAPHELSEAGDSHEQTSRRERVLEIIAALLLSVATVAVAWSGFQAARWSGIQSERYTQASAARSLANRDQTVAAEERLQDLTNFNRWLELSTAGDEQLADLYERRFRREFVPAFEAWLAQDPLNNPEAIPSPLRMPEYRLAEERRSDRLEEVAHERFTEGKEATERGDRYVYTTVFFAAVMFFAGMSLRFAWPAMRISVLVFAAALLTYGVVLLITMPTA